MKHGADTRSSSLLCPGLAAAITLIALSGSSPVHPVLGQSAPADIPFLADPIAQHGGVIAAIAPDPDGQRLWIGHGPRVEAVDVRDPAAPRIGLRGPRLEAIVSDIVVDGDRLIVAAGQSLQVFGIGEDELVPLGSLELPLAVERISGRAGIVFARLAGEGHPLASVDLRDPRRATLFSTNLLEGEGTVTDLLVRGQRLYVTTARAYTALLGERGAALHVFDISQPAQPVRLATLEDEAWGLLAAPAGTTSHHLYGYGKGVLAMDLADPSAPELIQRWGQAPDQRRLLAMNPRLVVNASGRVFVFKAPTFGNSAIWTPDPRDPDGAWLGLASMLGFPSGGFAAFGESLAFAESGGRISILRTDAGSLSTGRSLAGSLDLIGTVYNVAFDPSQPDLLVVATDTGGLGSLSLGPGNTLEQLGFAYDGHYDRGLSISGRVAALQDRGVEDVSDNRWVLHDLRDPRRPRPAGRIYPGNGPSDAHARSGPTLFLPSVDERSHSDAVEFWDVSKPDEPRSIATWPVAGELASFAIDAGRLVIAQVARRNGAEPLRPLLLEVVDVSRPGLPRLLRRIDTGLLDEVTWTAFPRVAASGSHAYVMTADWLGPERDEDVVGLMYVFDLEGPEGSPIASMRFEDGLMSISAIGGGFLFTGSLVIDIREPAAPRVVARVPRGGVMAIDPVGGRLFARDAVAGLWVYAPQLDWQLEPAPPTYTAAPTVTPTATPTPTHTMPPPRPSRTPTTSPTTSPTSRPPSQLLLPWLLQRARAAHPSGGGGWRELLPTQRGHGAPPQG